ncbi:MAG: M20/M25/M40 family metallo-hydrolase, partial [Anaerolineae bacterium]
MSELRAYIEANRERFLADLCALCAIPSVSKQREPLEQAAAFVVDRLRAVGAQVQLLPTPKGPPVVFGQVGSGPRSLLSYSHYDVQPEDPLELWETPPFQPTVRDGHLFARGAA